MCILDVMVVGDTISIPRINRDHMGIYVCTADNGVPPQATQTFSLEVHCEYRTIAIIKVKVKNASTLSWYNRNRYIPINYNRLSGY